MSQADALLGALGGALIGLAATLLLLTTGRIAGVSGILGGIARPDGRAWRALFIIGLVSSGLALVYWLPERFVDTLNTPAATLVVAGALVGFGTRLGSGCTSGHGVCGLSRASGRSLSATLTFMAAAAITVYVMRHLLGAA